MNRPVEMHPPNPAGTVPGNGRQLPEPVQWSNRRWFYTVLAVLLAQVGLVFYLGQGIPEPAPSRTFSLAVYPANDPWAAQQVEKLPFLQDPTLMVLPRQHTFSDRAWLSFPAVTHRLSDWSEPPRWLDFDARPMGAAFVWYAQTLTNAPLLIANQPLPRLTGSDLSVPNRPFATQTVAFLEGELASRPVLSPVALCSWQHAELLTNTVVKLAVDAEGLPVTTVLLTASGSPEADLYALRQAAALRFEPQPQAEAQLNADARLSWGKLIFQWYTVPPSGTNTPGALP